MAIINKTGITDGGTIQAEHITRTIDALSGVSTDSIVATGSFTGSFVGNGAGLTGITTSTSASFSTNATSASIATTASYALNIPANSVFPYTGSARITGSLAITGSFIQTIPGEGVIIESTVSGSNVSKLTLGHNEISIDVADTTFSANAQLNLSNIFKGAGFRIPITAPDSPAAGTMYFDISGPTLFIYDGSQWVSVNLSA